MASSRFNDDREDAIEFAFETHNAGAERGECFLEPLVPELGVRALLDELVGDRRSRAINSSLDLVRSLEHFFAERFLGHGTSVRLPDTARLMPSRERGERFAI
jgi:hypothetical protein